MTDETEYEYDYPTGSGAGLGQCTPEQIRAAMRVPTQVPSREQELQAQLTEARAVLKLVEWFTDPENTDCVWCQVCKRQGHKGHAPDCRLKKALEKT